MRRRRAALLGAMGFALGAAGTPDMQAAADVVWLGVCGQPGMRIALPLDRQREAPGDEECAQACHAALWRKSGAAPGLSGAKGARV